MADKITCALWLCFLALSLDSISATYTREASGENTKSVYSSTNSISGASETSRKHTKQTLDEWPAYRSHAEPREDHNRPVTVNPSVPVYPAGYGSSGHQTVDYGRDDSGSYGGCTATECPLRPRQPSARNSILDASGTEIETKHSRANEIDIRDAYTGQGGVGGELAHGYGGSSYQYGLPTQTHILQAYRPAESGAIQGLEESGGAVTSPGYGSTPQLVPSSPHSSPYQYGNAQQPQPGTGTNRIEYNAPSYGNYPAGYPPYYPPSGVSPSYPYQQPPNHGQLPPPTAHGHYAPHVHYPPQGYPPHGYPSQGYPSNGYPPQGYLPYGYPAHGQYTRHADFPPPPSHDHHHHSHGYNALDHSLKTKTEYNEVGHHEGQLQANAGNGYGSGYGGYNGAFNRPVF